MIHLEIVEEYGRFEIESFTSLLLFFTTAFIHKQILKIETSSDYELFYARYYLGK